VVGTKLLPYPISEYSVYIIVQGEAAIFSLDSPDAFYEFYFCDSIDLIIVFLIHGSLGEGSFVILGQWHRN
jgi:hypothetical protein